MKRINLQTNTIYKLITWNNTMSTNMAKSINMIKSTNTAKLKCLKYLYIWSHNIKDVEVIDWIYTK